MSTSDRSCRSAHWPICRLLRQVWPRSARLSEPTGSGAAFLGCYGFMALHRPMHPQRLTAELGGAAMTLRGALATVAAFTLLNPHVYLDNRAPGGLRRCRLSSGAQTPFVIGAGQVPPGLRRWDTARGFWPTIRAHRRLARPRPDGRCRYDLCQRRAGRLCGRR